MPSPPSEPREGDLPSPDEAFALLGNDTGVAILQALWDAFESGTGDNTLAYSALYEAVPVDDSGNFSYHLEKPTGPFVRQTDEGYELKQTGINVVRAVFAGTVIDDPAFGPTPVDVDCPICESAVEVTYADEVMDVSCSSCEGRIQWRGEDGHLFGALVPPIATEERTVEETFRAATVYTMHRIAAFHDGVCAHCSSPVETTVDVCADHDPEAGTRCPACDRSNLAEARMRCGTCKLSLPPPVALVVLDHSDVAAFYREHGVDYRYASWETVARSYDVGETLLSKDPLRMRVSVPAGDEELKLTLDESLDVLDVSR